MGCFLRMITRHRLLDNPDPCVVHKATSAGAGRLSLLFGIIMAPMQAKEKP